MEKASLFICSSSSALDVAEALQENLSADFFVETWKQGAFGVSQTYIESLVSVKNKFHYVLIVLTADEEISTNLDAKSFTPRDNVIFEIGFWIGVFGKSRTFFIHENNKNIKLPAYIEGINYAKFSRPLGQEISLTAALGPASASIKKIIRHNTIVEDNEKVDKMVTSALLVVSRALCMPLTPEEAKLRAFIFKKDNQKLVCTHLWAPYDIQESLGLTFDINAESEKQVAVVMAATKKKVCAVSVSVLPENINGLHGEVDRDLCFILSAPIIGPKGQVWGTVDFDASNMRGENLLRHEISQNVIYSLGKHLYGILTAS